MSSSAPAPEKKAKKSATIAKNINPLGGKPITPDCKVYSCRLCRKLLFTSNDLLPHDATKDAKGHKKFKFQDWHDDAQKAVCTSLFLDPDVAKWVAAESLEVQNQRFEQMEKERQNIEDEEIFGPGGRPKTPPLQAPLVYGSDKEDDDGDDDRFGDDFENKEEEHQQIVLTAPALAAAAAAADTKKKAAASDSDSDEEIISSDDEKPAANKKKSALPAHQKVVAAPKKVARPTTSAAAAAAEEDSDEDINDDDEDFDDEDFDDDDFKSNYGGGGHNAARRQKFRVAKAALDIVDPDTVYCPHCTCKIGQQNWIGSQCSCGAWVTPAFKVHAKAVDVIPGTLYLNEY